MYAGKELTKTLNKKDGTELTETGAWDAGAGALLPCATAAPAPSPIYTVGKDKTIAIIKTKHSAAN